ncbi:helix-turn-helix transcriptional regulator [Jannaschia sp. M317]|uniref:helix-turn-helix domain-containing protein n=1 Tax=Jannaschia sp. M317 TaxID=2867011 RepID=UPI0021A3E70E|nr:helix-turn-helix transcriptional regulator [Jannaschia sp. M317]UWQ17419.1 helix-turn-helix transcriptional regulator [Jannaschia sp. M317]
MRGDIFETLRLALRARGMTYADLAGALSVSEPTIKRLFAGRDAKLSRVEQICDVLGVTLAEVMDRAARPDAEPVELPPETEAALAADPSLFHLFILLRDHVPQATIQAEFGLSAGRMLRLGLALERLGLAEVATDGMVRLRLRHPIRFRRRGPLHAMLRAVNLRFLSEVVDRADAPGTAFLSLTRRMAPDTARQITEELEALHKRIRQMARQDMLTRPEADLRSYKLSAGWAEVDFMHLITITEDGSKR